MSPAAAQRDSWRGRGGKRCGGGKREGERKSLRQTLLLYIIWRYIHISVSGVALSGSRYNVTVKRVGRVSYVYGTRRIG